MQFRDLKAQYQALKSEIDQAVSQVITDSNFISGKQVTELEKSLAEYVGVKHCIACANGTGAGNLLTEAINKYDNGVIVGVSLFYAILSVVAIILGDVLMSMVDPRISFSSKER